MNDEDTITYTVDFSGQSNAGDANSPTPMEEALEKIEKTFIDKKFLTEDYWMQPLDEIMKTSLTRANPESTEKLSYERCKRGTENSSRDVQLEKLVEAMVEWRKKKSNIENTVQNLMSAISTGTGYDPRDGISFSVIDNPVLAVPENPKGSQMSAVVMDRSTAFEKAENDYPDEYKKTKSLKHPFDPSVKCLLVGTNKHQVILDAFREAGVIVKVTPSQAQAQSSVVETPSQPETSRAARGASSDRPETSRAARMRSSQPETLGTVREERDESATPNPSWVRRLMNGAAQCLGR